MGSFFKRQPCALPEKTYPHPSKERKKNQKKKERDGSGVTRNFVSGRGVEERGWRVSEPYEAQASSPSFLSFFASFFLSLWMEKLWITWTKKNPQQACDLPGATPSPRKK
jgi:hypothetical protein